MLHIERLELLGNLLLIRLICNVIGALRAELNIRKSFCWTDSTISLAWIKSTNKEFKTFIQNRVLEIRKNVHADNWFYCRSEVNPADLATRCGGELSHDWLNGPAFLWQTKHMYPR